MIRRILIGVEVVVLTALILATRCGNHAEVFVNGVYFTNADCYARMTRALAQMWPNETDLIGRIELQRL